MIGSPKSMGCEGTQTIRHPSSSRTQGGVTEIPATDVDWMKWHWSASKWVAGRTTGGRTVRSLLGGIEWGEAFPHGGRNELYSSGLGGPSLRYSRALFA